MVMIFCMAIALIAESAFGQEQRLVTEEEFQRKLAPGESSHGPKIRLRSISVEKRQASEIAIHLLFDSGSADLSDDFSKRQLHEAGKALRSSSLEQYRFEIGGHTDNVGSVEFNQTLSEKRAAFVRNYLVTHFHIDENRLSTKGYGELYPVNTNRTEKGRSQNRRVVFRRVAN